MHPTIRYVLPLLLASCTSTHTHIADTAGAFAVPGKDPTHHHLRFADGQVSPNDSCMILLGNNLNPKVPPMYVNGLPLGFC